MNEDQRRKLGMQTRRSVLGDTHVDRTIAATIPLTEAFQDLITRYAWGEIWSRPAIDHPTRRLLTIAMLIALGREAELEMHLGAGLDHGLPAELLSETILQSAIYCGVPAANSAYAILAELVRKHEGQG